MSIADANLKLQLGTGILFAVPIPKEHSASGGLIESAIQTALKEARLKTVFSCFLFQSLFVLKHIFGFRFFVMELDPCSSGKRT